VKALLPCWKSVVGVDMGVVRSLKWQNIGPENLSFPDPPTLAMKKLATEEIHGRHKNELIFIFGNGPSLLLADEYRKQIAKFASIGIYVSYWFIYSKYIMYADIWKVSVRCHNELLLQDSYVFCSRNPPDIPLYNTFARYQGKEFSSNWDEGLCKTVNSMIPALNLAYLFGASEIALLGIDLNDADHFYLRDEYADRPYYKELGIKLWGKCKKDNRFPNVKEVVRQCGRAVKFLENRGIKVWNCSPNSLLNCCEKIDIATLLSRKHHAVRRGDGVT